MCMIGPIVSKTALSEQKQDSLFRSWLQRCNNYMFAFFHYISLFCPPREAWLVTSPSAPCAQLLLLEPCISRSMTPAEQRYAQVEKEALALTWHVNASQIATSELNSTFRLSLVPIISTLLCVCILLFYQSSILLCC